MTTVGVFKDERGPRAIHISTAIMLFALNTFTIFDNMSRLTVRAIDGFQNYRKHDERVDHVILPHDTGLEHHRSKSRVVSVTYS